MSQELEHMIPIAQAIESLLFPHAEVVIHDLKSLQIYAIFNPFSKRRKGDPSELHASLPDQDIPDYFPPYFTMNQEGRQVKSTTAKIKDRKGKSVGLLCINFDVTKLKEVAQVIESFSIPASTKLPEVLFQDDPREKIHQCVLSYLNEKRLSFDALSGEEKAELVRYLEKKGAFKVKNAALHIGQVLKLSRATVYNYLRESE